jgi:hypothetical protein
MGWNQGDRTATSNGAPPVASPARLASHVFEAEGTQYVFYQTAGRYVVELWWRGSERARSRYLTTPSNKPPAQCLQCWLCVIPCSRGPPANNGSLLDPAHWLEANYQP